MKKTRTHLALIAMVASMSLLAACSKGEDANTPADGAAGMETPAPAPAPAPSDTPAPAPSSSDGSTMKESAKQAADTISDKAVELKDSAAAKRSEEHTSELQSLMRISYAVFCLTKTKE